MSYEDEYREKGWFEVEVTYYDSPREDCSGYYTSSYFYPTAKEAYKAAFHMNRQNEPRLASVNLRSPRTRRFNIEVNDQIVVSTYSYSEFQKELAFWRELNVKTKHKCDYKIKFV